jgi:hypothetical protein
MLLDEFPKTAEIRALFAEEVAAAGGAVSDTFDDGSRLFARSILPQVREVRAGDKLQGGVALRATGEEVWVHPYVFRLVCRNGAIMAHALQTRHIEGCEFTTAEGLSVELRTAVRACCGADAFQAAVTAMRSAQEREADLFLNLLPHLSRMPSAMVGQIFGEVTQRFTRERDRSLFGLMNAVTAVARDTEDAELRWRLEELGGGIPAGRTPVPRPAGGARKEALVG